MIELAIKYWYVLVIAGLLAALGVEEVRLAEGRATVAKIQKDAAEEKALEYDVQLKEKAERDKAKEDLDTKYTKELSDAKQQIADLSADVSAGTRRLRVNAVCPNTAGRVAKTASAPGVDDGSGPGLTDGATRHYFGLRSGIETASKQIAGLQDYITNVCLK